LFENLVKQRKFQPTQTNDNKQALLSGPKRNRQSSKEVSHSFGIKSEKELIYNRFVKFIMSYSASDN